MFRDYICFNMPSSFFEILKVEGIYVKVIKENSKSKIIRMIEERRKNKEIVIVEGGMFNRSIVENKNVDILLSPEKEIDRDGLHARNSGLNQVLCKLARKNDIAIGFSFNEILYCEREKRAEIMGRMMQNVRLCRKYKVKMIIGSFASDEYGLRSRDSLMSFGLLIGMNYREAKEAVDFKD